MENQIQQTVTGIEVYKAIASIAALIAKEGIKKARQNTQQNYSFRGIDDIYNALAPKLVEAGLVIIPRLISREAREVSDKNGKAIFFVNVIMEYDFISCKDGSKHTAKISGEAMDYGDKASNKAISAAYKYLCLQTFCIPTESDNDADATTFEVASALAAPVNNNTNQTNFTNQYQKNLQDAISNLFKCDTLEELSLLKSTLPPEIVTNPEFKTKGLAVFEAIKQAMEDKKLQPAQ